MTTSLKRLGIILFASYVFFRFYFNFISSGLQQVAFFGFLVAYIFFNKDRMFAYLSKLGSIHRPFMLSLILYAGIALGGLFIPIIYQTRDFSYLNSFIRTLTYLVSYLVLLDLIKQQLKPKSLKVAFMRIYISAACNYVLFSLVALLFPPLKFFWQSIIVESERNLYLVNTNPHYLTRFGWTGFSAFSVSFSITLALVFAMSLLVRKWQSERRLDSRLTTSLVFLLMGGAFYGRVGLIAMIVVLGLTLMYLTYKEEKLHFLIYIMGGFTALFLLFTIVQFFNPTLSYWYRWIMEPVLNLFSTGELTTTSTQHLFEMYQTPSLRTILLGDGYYTSPMGTGYYMGVDVGLLRPLFFFGIGNVLLAYTIPLLLIGSMIRMDHKNTFLAYLIVAILVLFEIKGEVNIALIPLLYTLVFATADSQMTLSKREVHYG